MRKSRLIRVNSRFGQGTNTRFNYFFDNRNVDNVNQIVLLSANIPRLFGNIYEPINVLTYSDGLSTYNLVVPTGQYTAVELAAALNQRADIVIGYDEVRHRFTFRGYGTILTSSSIANYIGVSSDLTMEASEQVVYAESPPNLAGPSQIYLQSEFMCGTQCCDTPALSPFIPLFTPVDCSAIPFGYTINYSMVNENSNAVSWNGSVVGLRRIDFELCDVYGNVLVLPRNAFIDLVFRIYIE